MWWCSDLQPAPGRRRALRLAAALALPAALAGCGFRPLYGGARGNVAAADLAAVEVHAPLTRLGRILENQLIDDLNPGGLAVAKRYRLDLTLERNKKALAIQLDDTITRFDLTVSAIFALRPIAGADAGEPPADVLAAGEASADDATTAAEGDAGRPAPLYRSAVRRVASYNVIREPFATLIAEQDAERRAAVEVSREIRTLLTIFFENHTA